jgi:hypothetical protein
MFRFTIRDVLWLTALVAVLAAWWVDRSQLDAYARKLKSDFQMQRAFDDISASVR